MTIKKQSAKIPAELKDVKDPELYRDMFPYSSVPRVVLEDRMIQTNIPKDIWITDTSFRDGQQSMPPYTVKQVVDLYKMQPVAEHSHGLTEREFDSLFTTNKPVIFNFHGYPWLIHKLAYRFKNHENLHVRGYKEKGNINTPLELAILNQIDRFDLVIDVIDRVPGLAGRAAHLKEDMKNAIIDNLAYAHTNGTDREEITSWVWPY